MTPAQYARLRELFLAARELGPDARAAFVDALGADDAALRTQLARLLAADAERTPFLAAPALGEGFAVPAPERLQASDLPPGQPEHFGSYRLLGVLGQGGMGIVYRAMQLSPPREVALKVLKPGNLDGPHLARFRFEVEALGRLQHPGIAAIHDAGTFDQGAGPQPFLAMELVDGKPLLDHAREARLDRASRVRLLAAIADAIQHAHQRGVVHRDLKPANVLVDGRGQPKVLDFGIAAARDGDAVDVTRTTNATQLLGTLPYMSPEQLGSDRRAIDTRTDVYSLGVTAYELLAGQRPFALDGLSLVQAARLITETAPRPLGALDASLRGDLDTIVAMAMAKSPEQRYGSAGDLAADLRRWLAHEPIAAQPPGNLHRLRLFTRRHRALVVGTASTALALLLGLLATMRALSEAQTARDLAQTRLVAATTSAERAEAVRSFVLSMLGKLDPRGGEGDTGIDRVLASATRELERHFTAHPDLEAELRLVLGGVLRLFGRYAEAQTQIAASVALRTQEFGVAAPATLEARSELVKVLRDHDRLAEALAMLEPLLADCDRVFGPDDARTLACRHLDARCRLIVNDLAGAEQRLQPLLSAIERVPTLPPELRVDVQMTLADSHLARGDTMAAHRILTACLAESRSHLGEDDPTTIDVATALATLLLGTEAAELAAPLLEQVRRHHTARLPAAHPRLLQCEHNDGMLASARGDFEAAADHFRTASDGRAVVFGPRHVRRISSLLSGANALARTTRNAEAARWFDEVLEAIGDGVPSQPWLRASARGWSAINQARLGNLEFAVAELRASIAELEALEGPDSPRVERFRPLLEPLLERIERSGGGK